MFEFPPFSFLCVQGTGLLNDDSHGGDHDDVDLVGDVYTDNFIPESVDATKPGTLEARRWQEGTKVTVERATTQVRLSSVRWLRYVRLMSMMVEQGKDSGSKEFAHRFTGPEVTAKEVDCVLIYDEAGGVSPLVTNSQWPGHMGLS